ncbi:MAG: CE1 family esterase [Acidimicrobiales bacterium]
MPVLALVVAALLVVGIVPQGVRALAPAGAADRGGGDGPAPARLMAVAEGSVASVEAARAVTPRAVPPAPVTWVTTYHQIMVGGLSRTYLVTRPSATSAIPLPVLMVLHGVNVTPLFEEQRTNFTSVVGAAILVYPAGYQESWNAGNCCAGAQAARVQDAIFLPAVLHQVLAAQPDADARRVYLAGYSNGGKMALLLACDDPGLFAGVGVYGAVGAIACPGPPPASLVEVASTGDPELTIGPGGTPQKLGAFVEPTVTGEVGAYRSADACQEPGTQAVQGVLVSVTWSQCAGGDRVELALYSGGSHTWPAGGNGTPSGEQVIWAFFRSLGA